MFPQKALPMAFPAPELSGLFAAPSVGSPSAFVGVEGAAQRFFVTVTEIAGTVKNKVAVLVPLQLIPISGNVTHVTHVTR